MFLTYSHHNDIVNDDNYEMGIFQREDIMFATLAGSDSPSRIEFDVYEPHLRGHSSLFCVFDLMLLTVMLSIDGITITGNNDMTLEEFACV